MYYCCLFAVSLLIKTSYIYICVYFLVRPALFIEIQRTIIDKIGKFL